jgi:putative restriction endonuclease
LVELGADGLVDVTAQDGVYRTFPTGPTEYTAITKLRRGQWFFRQVVLNAYGDRCALTGLNVREFLVASHIVPWSGPHGKDCPSDELFGIQAAPPVLSHRLDVRNGIALNALHDKAFDDGFITFDKKLCMVLSPHLKHLMKAEVVARHFKPYLKKPLTFPPEAAGPDPRYLEWHREWAFRASAVF